MLTCIVCGCTSGDACIDPETGKTCSWVELENDVYEFGGMGLCDFCAGIPDPLLQDAAYAKLLHLSLQKGLDKPTDSERDAPLGLDKPTDSERDAPLIELVSEAEANRYLRARRTA